MVSTPAANTKRNEGLDFGSNRSNSRILDTSTSRRSFSCLVLASWSASHCREAPENSTTGLPIVVPPLGRNLSSSENGQEKVNCLLLEELSLVASSASAFMLRTSEEMHRHIISEEDKKVGSEAISDDDAKGDVD